MRTATLACALVCAAGISASARAQAPAGTATTPAAAATAAATAAVPTPDSLVARLLTAVAARDTATFDALVSDRDARQLLRWAAANDWPLRADGGGVVRAGSHRAVVWLAAHPEVGNTGHEMALGKLVTGLFEAERTVDGWRLARRLPLDAGNRLHGQALGVVLHPGAGLDVRDTLDVSVRDADGFRAYLNHAVTSLRATLDGRPVAARLTGGLLHVPMPPGRHRIALAYELDVARDSARNGNFSRFAPDFGHVRNQHYWHPSLDWSREEAQGTVRLTVRAPAAVHVVTSLPQRDTVTDGTRLVRARSTRPTAALSLFYDAAWRPQRLALGGLQADVYTGAGFEPARPTFDSALVRVHEVLARAFGEPRAEYLAFVQVRGASSYGWHFRSNDVVGAGARGGELSRAGAAPQHFLGHETAHAWTNPTGPASLFLVEGWATFAESVLLRAEYGEAVERAFWERQRTRYHREGYDGRESLLDDASNTGVSYVKGAWVFRMLRDWVGDSAFAQGVRAYVAIPPERPRGVAELTAALSRSSGRDVGAFLRPWLEGTRLPDLDARLDDGRVIVTQRGTPQPLRVELELVTGNGSMRRVLDVTRAEDTLDVRELGTMREVRLDPDLRLLRRRHRGEVARFELRADDARAVALVGSFSPAPIPATRVDGVWRVEVPLTEGWYSWSWSVDGRRQPADRPNERVVRPVVRVEDGWPR